MLPTLVIDFQWNHSEMLAFLKYFWEKIYYKIWWLDISPLNILKRSKFRLFVDPWLALLYERLWCKQEDPEIFWWIRLSLAKLSKLLQGSATLYELLQKRLQIINLLLLLLRKKDMAPSNNFQVLTRVFEMTIMYLEKYFEVWIDLVKAEVVFSWKISG